MSAEAVERLWKPYEGVYVPEDVGEWLSFLKRPWRKSDEKLLERESIITQAITTRVSGAAKTAANGNLSAIALPTGHVTNDILGLPVVSHDNIAFGTPAGWTKEFDISNGTTCHFAFFWVRDTGSITAPTVTHTAGDSIVGQIGAWVGCNTTGNPFIDGTPRNDSGTSSGGVSVTCTANGISPQFSNSAIVFLNALTSVATDANPAHSGWSGTNPAFTENCDGVAALGTGAATEGSAWGIGNGTPTGNRTVSVDTTPTGAWLAQSILLELKDASPIAVAGGQFRRVTTVLQAVMRAAQR